MNKYYFFLFLLSLFATTSINSSPAFAKKTATGSSIRKTSEAIKLLSDISINYHLKHRVLTSSKSLTQTQKITEGKYLTEQNLFEVTLQVQGDKFRLQEAGNLPERWQSISKLQYIKLGIVYFDGFYWCSEQAPRLPQNSGKPISIYQGVSRACTANGWVEK